MNDWRSSESPSGILIPMTSSSKDDNLERSNVWFENSSTNASGQHNAMSRLERGTYTYMTALI